MFFILSIAVNTLTVVISLHTIIKVLFDLLASEDIDSGTKISSSYAKHACTASLIKEAECWGSVVRKAMETVCLTLCVMLSCRVARRLEMFDVQLKLEDLAHDVDHFESNAHNVRQYASRNRSIADILGLIRKFWLELQNIMTRYSLKDADALHDLQRDVNRMKESFDKESAKVIEGIEARMEQMTAAEASFRQQQKSQQQQEDE